MKGLRLIFTTSFSLCISPLFAQLPKWVDDIAPLVHDHCARCHHEGGAGPFFLLTYEGCVFYRIRGLARHARRHYTKPLVIE